MLILKHDRGKLQLPIPPSDAFMEITPHLHTNFE